MRVQSFDQAGYKVGEEDGVVVAGKKQQVCVMWD